MTLMSSCSSKQECGFPNYASFYNEYYICDSLLKKDTIDFGSDYTVDEDSIRFILPPHFSIVKAMQSFIITPSIWSKESDGVVQYKEFIDLEKYCIRQESILTNNDTILNPMKIEQKLIDELYFRERAEISKKELLNSIKQQFKWKERSPDEYTTAEDIESWRIENDQYRKTYFNYLRNYTTWKNAPNWEDDLREENPNFELLITKRYLTLSIKNGQHVKDITFIYSPIYGN